MGRFAGSKTLDARRRRRLAAEDDVPGMSTDVLPEPTPRSGAEESSMSPHVDNKLCTHLPLERLIRRSPLQSLTLITFIGLTATGLVFVNRLPLVTEQTWGPNVAALLEFPHGAFAVLFRCGLVFGCSLLCFLIGWTRSRSQSDYSGEYRIWKWAWKCWAVAGICMATDAHVAFADVFSRVAQPTWNHPELLNWALPAALLGLPIQLRCWRDMSRCWLSTSLVAIAVTVFAVVCASPLFAAWDFLPAYIPLIHLAVCGTAFAGLLLHARFVLHINIDPPESPLHQTDASFLLPTGTIESLDEFATLDADEPEPLPSETPGPIDAFSQNAPTPDDVLETALDLSAEFEILKQPDPVAATELPAETTQTFRIETPQNEHEIPPAVVKRRRKRSRR